MQNSETLKHLPVYIRYSDLVVANIVRNWPSLQRLVAEENFPPGRLFGPNTRAWTVDEVQAWLAARPTARKIVPITARHPRVLRKRVKAGAKGK
jgi:hypothetical protein